MGKLCVEWIQIHNGKDYLQYGKHAQQQFETARNFLYATFCVKIHCNRTEVFPVVDLFSDHNLLAGKSMHVTSHVVPLIVKRDSFTQLLLLLKPQRKAFRIVVRTLMELK